MVGVERDRCPTQEVVHMSAAHSSRALGRHPFGAGCDFTHPVVLLCGTPVREFAVLRNTAPVSSCVEPETIFGDLCSWVISRHNGIKIISCNSDLCWTN